MNEHELRPADPSATSPRANAVAQVNLVDPARWQQLLWVRDRLRERRSALLVGDGACLAAVLLAREGVRAIAFDPDPARVREVRESLAGDFPGVEARVRLHALKAKLPTKTLSKEKFDAVMVTEGPKMGLEPLLASIVDLMEHDSRATLVVPFGHSAGSNHVKGFPSTVASGLPDFVVEDMSIVDGVIHALLTRHSYSKAIGSPLGSAEILCLTEVAYAEGMRALESKIHRLKSQLAGMDARKRRLEMQVKELHESTSFQLGFAIVTAVRSPRQFLRLPWTLFAILRNRKHGMAGSHSSERSSVVSSPTLLRGSGMSEWQKEALRNRVRSAIDGGLFAIRDEVQTFLVDEEPAVLAMGYMVAAQTCAQQSRHDLEFSLGTLAIETHRSVGILRGFLHVSLRARQMQSASDALRELHVLSRKGSKPAIAFLKNFRETSSYKIAALELIPPRPERWHAGAGDRFAYVLHNSLPYSSGGYATRSQGVARGLADVGFRVTCATRPGFPFDVKPGMTVADLPETEQIDGVEYIRLPEPSRIGQSEYQYIRSACEAMTRELERLAPAYVQAGSNYVTGLPALVAARKLGVPFFYEVRGLWEITRLSRDEDFGRSISFDVQRHIESTLAREADHVFTLTEPMREELIERGVEPARITLLPNSVDAERFHAKARNQQLATELGIPAEVPVIGYVGTFVVYEGLEDLASACVQLHQGGRDFRLLLVGNENASGQDRGPITEEILRIAEQGGISDKLIMPGRIPHEQVEDFYSLIDVCPFPRKPWPVCEMVSPMKPLEALAMKKAVVVSSVRALTEMIADGQTGLVFEKGNVSSLADVIIRLLDDPEMCRRLGEAGREWVTTQRSWRQVAERVVGVVEAFEAERMQHMQSEAVVDGAA